MFRLREFCASKFSAAVLCAVLAFAGGHAQAAVDGNAYAVIAPTYLNPNTTQSYVRLFNGTSATSTYTIKAVGSPSGNVYGTITYPIASHAEIQKAISTILGDLAAGPLKNGDTGFSLYVSDPDIGAGYQHVIFNAVTSLYEDVSNCRTSLNAAIGSLGNNAAVIAVHTSLFAAFPASVEMHNYRAIPVEYRVTVIDAASGNTICKPGVTDVTQCYVPIDLQANETQILDFTSAFQTPLSWSPSGGQFHANLLITDPSLGAPPNIMAGAVIRNAALNGNIEMTTACSVNPVTVSATAVSTSAATTFDGTISGTTESGTFTFTVAASATPSSAPLAASLDAADSVQKTLVSFDRPQGVQNATGALKLSTSSTPVTLSGTFNTTTSAITLTGGGYTIGGSVSGGAFAGTHDSASVAGSYTDTDGGTGTFRGNVCTVPR